MHILFCVVKKTEFERLIKKFRSRGETWRSPRNSGIVIEGYNSEL